MTGKRKIVKQDITEDQFMNILGRACNPIELVSESDSKEVQPSESRQGDDCNGTHIHSDKTVNT